ncbi:UNVERIFIED_ORG: iron complex outermembrane recepter protein [Burkholderia sp. CF145]|uniref:TonB-dependent siderophore receptor n=1 Tax=Paraburkholderia hospita TaxID=169430 RepID=UPI0002718B28|nr:TonB-dependent receptor [Paraburkholderia hospita]EUC16365.1 TonB-dependent siderophore receptor [Burkholderia sp. BT03]SKC79640.1 TonB-dependent siderophore receptor [Paraburkholderia hospita]
MKILKSDHHALSTHRFSRYQSVLGAALLISVGLALSTAPSRAHAEDAVAADATLPAVSVKASADNNAAQADKISAGALGTLKQVDTPFSTHVVTSEEAQDLFANTANDLFQYDPAVSITGTNAIGENSTFNVRGMPIDTLNSIKVDGQSFPSWDTDLALEPFEQVELLKGLSGFMYGFGSPGGIVNYVLKRPTDTPYRSFSVGYQSAGVFSEKLDVGGRFGTDDRFGYRFNLVNEEGNTAEANGHLRRQVASAALDFRITPDLTWTVDAFYTKRKQEGTIFGLMFGSDAGGIPDASLVTHNLSQPQNYYQVEMASFGTGLDYRLSENWHASVKYRFAKENRTNSDSLLYVYNTAGDYSNTLYAAMTRYFYQNVDAMVEGKFNTGSIKHDVVFGAGYQSQVTEYDNSEGWNDGYSLGVGNIYSSTFLTNADVHIGENLYKQSRTTQAAVYASDTVQFTPRISALLGLRYTQFHQFTYDPTGATTANYSASPVTPTVALMYKTDPYSTLYVSYVQSLEQGGSAANTNLNYPATFGPLRSKQYEVGFKTDRSKWGANLALFRVDQGYYYTNSANIFVQDGTKRYTGVDASGWLQLASDWRVMGGVMWLDTKAVDIDDPTIEGKRIYGAPRWTVTGRVEYNPSYMRRLTLAFGGRYVSDMAVDAANTQFVPAYTVFDLSGKYETRIAGKEVTFRAGINNLLNRRYWTTAWGYYVSPSATRTAVASATMQF